MYEFIRVGERIKLKEWTSYTSRQINPWAWFIVEGRRDEYVDVCLDEARDRKFTIKADEFSKPIGYEEVYHIEVPSIEKARMVKSWLDSRGGISVWTSEDLSSAGRTMYLPGDRNEKPHWSMGFVEVVTDPKRIKIMVVETSNVKKTYKEKAQGWSYDRRCKEWFKLVEWKGE